MSTDPQLFRVNPESKESNRVEEVEFAALGLKEVQHIQEWVAANPSILGEDLLVVAKEFRGFDRTNERLDLLAVDRNGKLVIIELKRDDSGEDVHWQAIKYASYLQNANVTNIIEMLADHDSISQEEATNRILQHLGADDLNGLNNDQRIILASHRFAREVTSAALWLNHKAAGEDLITCITLTPFRDAENGALYLQANTIIPVPGVDDYVVGIGGKSQAAGLPTKSSFAEKLQARFERNSSDDVTRFVRQVAELTLEGVPSDVRPDRTGRWAAGWDDHRYFHLWYSRPPWGNHVFCYQISLHRQEGPDTWLVDIGFKDATDLVLADLKGTPIRRDQVNWSEGVFVTVGTDTLNDNFANKVADLLRQFIERITPMVNSLQDLDNVEEA